MTLDLHATPEEVMRAVETLQEFGRSKGVPEKALFGLALALEECGSNIVNHALQRDARRKFQVMLEEAGDAVTLELRDAGLVFDPTQVQLAEPGSAEDDRPPGGWGIQLVRRYMDEIHYRRESGQNVLRLTKRIAPATKPE